MNRYSTVGRPRRLTDAQVHWILKEHDRYQAWRALRVTVHSHRELAQALGVSAGTVAHAIRNRGHYKRHSPTQGLA
jgi:hypothetical protein